jgi:hypothetical protein
MVMPNSLILVRRIPSRTDVKETGTLRPESGLSDAAYAKQTGERQDNVEVLPVFQVARRDGPKGSAADRE